GQIRLLLEFDPRQFGRDQVAEIGRRYTAALTAIVAAPDAAVTAEPPDDRLAGLSAAKRELLDRWLSDEPEERDVTAPYTPPRTDVERTLVDIFQQELGAERVGIDDDYFELGGDS